MDVLRIQRLIESGRTRQVPAVHDDVRSADHLDGRFEGHGTHWRVGHLLRNHIVGQGGLDGLGQRTPGGEWAQFNIRDRRSDGRPPLEEECRNPLDEMAHNVAGIPSVAGGGSVPRVVSDVLDESGEISCRATETLKCFGHRTSVDLPPALLSRQFRQRTTPNPWPKRSSYRLGGPLRVRRSVPSCAGATAGDGGHEKLEGGVDFLEMNRQCLWTMESTAAMTDLALSSRALAPSRLLAD